MSDDCCWDLESPEVYREEVRTARKEHKCYECGGKINPGDKYRIHAGVWEHEWRTYKWCWACCGLLDKLHCDCREFGRLLENARDEGVLVPTS